MRLKVARVSGLTGMLVAGSIAALSAQQDSVESVERIHAALQKPPSRLVLESRKPDFSVHIEERRPLQHVFDLPAWVTPPRVWTPPASSGTGIDPVALARSLITSKRTHDARVEARRTIADYCKAQPDAASIQICSSSSPIR
jgi:hypothetical protein